MGRSKASVELFEQIRREYEFGVGSTAGVARKFGVHRRLVREALASAVPAERRTPRRDRPQTGPVQAFVDAILTADQKAPRKQRHTAHRIFKRIEAELAGCTVAEPTVRRFVRERRLALGLLKRETFVPQSYDWGVEAQVDWYEAYAELDGQLEKLPVFVLRSMASGAAFHVACLRATQQAFLEAHELAFHYYGGLFRRLRYDNLSAAVKRVLRGSRREETQRFVAFRSHWRFAAEFCNPGEGHEKGGVEGEVGVFRRNQWVPVPKVRDLAELNERLLAGCRADEARILAGRTETVGAALVIEREYLLPLAAEDFDLAEVSFPTVDSKGCVRVRTNGYSVPLPAGTKVEVRLLASAVVVWHAGKQLVCHERSYGRYQEILELEHYLDVLARKPGALAGSKPLAEWRRQGRWPASYDRFWQGLIERLGKQAGTRAMIELLQLGQRYGQNVLRTAIERALAMGAGDSAAVVHLLAQPRLQRPELERVDVAALARFDRPLPTLDAYDQLLVLAVSP
jgi:transposase